MVMHKESGFKGFFGRATHKASIGVLEKIGVKVLKSVEINDPKRPEMKGEFMHLLYVDLKAWKVNSINDILGPADEDEE